MSTESAEGECRYYGQSQKLYISCAGSVNDDGDNIEAKEYAMGDPDFQRSIRYDNSDGNGGMTEFKYVPEISLNSTAVLNKEVESGISSVVWELPFTISNPLAKLSDVSDIKVEEIGGVYKRSATLDSGILTFSTPPRSMNIQITGLIQSTCSLNREVLLSLQDADANKTALVVEYTTEGAGSFTSLGACDGRHEYNAPTGFSGMKVVGVHSPDRADASLESVKFCKAGKLTKEDCLADLPEDPSLQQGDDIVVIEHLCDRVANGYVGGLVEFEDSSGSRDYFYAPVYCPGPCTESDVKNFKLDWEVDFKASVTDGKDKNKVEANQDDASYDGETKDLKKYSFLASEDLCGVDGKILGGLAESQLNISECGIFYDLNSSSSDPSDYAQREFLQATEIRAAFQSCGETASGSPEVFLVQHMHVDLIGENDDLYFCHSQKLKLDVQDLTNTSTATLAQVEQATEAEAAGTITASIDTVSYLECEDGGYKLSAVISVGSEGVEEKILYTEETGEPKFDEGNLTLVDNEGTLKYVGASCIDVCAPGSTDFYEDVFGFKGQLQENRTGDIKAELDIEFEFQILGSPCDAEQTITQGKVELKLFGKSNSNKVGGVIRDGAVVEVPSQWDLTCDNETVVHLVNGEVQVFDQLCSELSFSEMGDSSLKILSSVLTRKSPGTPPQVLSFDPSMGRFPLWTDGEILTSNTSYTSSKGYMTTFDDVYATFTLTVNWEQLLSGGSRRLLRSVHVFGASDGEVSADMLVLPASQQIRESADGGETLSDASHSTKDSAEDDKIDWGHPGLIVLYSIAGVFVILVARSLYRHGNALQSTKALLSGNLEDLERPRRTSYSQVRRSERFSVTRF